MFEEGSKAKHIGQYIYICTVKNCNTLPHTAVVVIGKIHKYLKAGFHSVEDSLIEKKHCLLTNALSAWCYENTIPYK